MPHPFCRTVDATGKFTGKSTAEYKQSPLKGTTVRTSVQTTSEGLRDIPGIKEANEKALTERGITTKTQLIVWLLTRASHSVAMRDGFYAELVKLGVNNHRNDVVDCLAAKVDALVLGVGVRDHSRLP